jgi:hypothetical protein
MGLTPDLQSNYNALKSPVSSINKMGTDMQQKYAQQLAELMKGRAMPQRLLVMEYRLTSRTGSEGAPLPTR